MKVYYVKNSSARAKEFQLTTTVYEENGQKYVKKEASCQESIAHLEQMKKNYALLSKSIINPKVKLAQIIQETPTTLTFEFIDGVSLESKFYQSLETSPTQAYRVIDEYKELVASSFSNSSTPLHSDQHKIFGDNRPLSNSDLYFEGCSNIDLIFSNIIYSGETIYIIDYEWVFEMPLMLEYVYFRAISSLNQKGLVEKYFNPTELKEFRAKEDAFLLGYVLNRDSFYQIQHYYLKDKIDPTQTITEQKATIQAQEETIQKLEELLALSGETVENKEQLIQEQHTHIQTLSNQIEELQAIAQSLRIKNRLKRLAPQKLLSPLRAVQKNPALLKKVFYYLKRGEIGYLWSKTKEKTEQSTLSSTNTPSIQPQEYFKAYDNNKYTIENRIIDIIIPVYNGYEFLEPLFDSLEKNTSAPHRLIVVNDCSPDERVKPLLLKRLEKHPTAIFVDHAVNLGFVKSVNEAYTYTKDHFLILNTDTEVPELWVERLMYPILQMENIATTTPFTNSGQIASFPNFIADNNIFEGMSVDALDAVFKEVNPDKFYSKVPTGVGFCMGVNYNLIQEIGFFVEEEFGRGYGEENDWCQRAIIHGYENLMVPNLFVYHKHGGSFSAEDKKKLMQENAIKLLHKHPNYDKDIQSYVGKDPHKVLRQLMVVVASSHDKEPLHLIIDQALGGGANHYTTARKEEYREQNKKILHLVYDYYASNYRVYFEYKEYNYSFILQTLKSLKELFVHLKFGEIFINNIVSFEQPSQILQWIEELTDTNQASLIVPIHDYYALCPNYTLLDPKGVFCEVPHGLQECQNCMKTNDLEWRTFVSDGVDMRQWRGDWENILTLADKIICFSSSSKEILLRAYKTLDSSKIEITPHQVAPLPPVTVAKKPKDAPITIGILGAINQAKGANIIEALVDSIEKDALNIKIVLIGEISKNISSDAFRVTGRYQRDQLPTIIQKEAIDIFLIPSVCPETFSYTTSEIMMMELPLMVFDLGAPASRVKEYSKGVVISKDYLQNTLAHIASLQNS